ncbi:hypothetical protein [Paraburkholderia adhaesiva]|uniref:hypothetical protein n=1 Tax=Paraburkholderia adhaesiva TaxID=2883244 RepID=UPI001F36EAAF|nr:hypothetical protein [Paraburkholderia adhaesiva]
MSDEALLAADFAAFEAQHPVPADQRELARTLFYFGAACVIDMLRMTGSGQPAPGEAQAVFDRVRREVNAFAMEQMVAHLFEGLTVEVIHVDAASSGAH